MSENIVDHPQREQLLEYGLGKLDPDKSDLIELHLAECDQCGETLLNLQDDTFVNLVRRSDALETPTENSEPKRVEDRPQASVMGATLVEGSAASEGELDLPASLAEHPRYRIVDLVGKGGMGDVYQAEHIVMNRPVALKIINRELVKKSQAVERFRREVHAAARLSHRNIVTAHDAEQAGDLHFLVMEFVDGIDLSRLVKERGALPVHEACDYARQAALGLQHAHEQGMVHRDIKPHNLMVTDDGTVKILDFGLAGFATETALIEAKESEGEGSDSIPLHLTTIGSVMGTPDYIAPEQARDAHSADIRADIYSLGCTLYFLLTGQPPHNATTVIEKLQAHAEHEPPAIESIRADVPEELAEVIRRMMAKEPQDRFQTPQEVADALVPFVDAHRSDGDFPQPGVRADDGSRWSKPDRFAIAMACLTACCLLLAQIGLNFVQLGVVWIVGMFVGLGITSGMKSDPPPRRLSSTGWFAWGASVVLAGIIFFVKTDYGTIRVELNDPDTTITIDDDMSINFRNAQNQLLTIRAGAHKLHIKQGETEFETETFRLRRNDLLVLKVDLVGDQLQAELQKPDELESKRMIGQSQSTQMPPRNYVLQFDGDGDYVETPIPDSGAEAITVEATVQIDDWGGLSNEEIVDNTNRGGFSLTSTQFGIYFAARLGNRYEKVSVYPDPKYLKRPIKLAGIRDGKTLRLFVDGRLVSQKTFEGAYIPSPSNISIGSNLSNRGKSMSGIRDWRGRLFEIRISETARYPGGRYDASQPLEADEQTLALYRFNAGQGDILKDFSGNGHDGKIVGAAWVKWPDESNASRLQTPTTADTREQFEEMIAAARAAETDEELQGVVSGYTPMLALLSQDAGRDLIELLAELPDEMHEALLLKGYLKWKADELDEKRKQVMLDMFAAVLSQAPNTENTRKKLEQLDAYANVSDVGFAVIGLPESDSQVLVWYFLRRDVRFPTVLMLSGSTSTALQEALKPDNHQEIRKRTATLIEKRYSNLPPVPLASREIRESLRALLNNLPEGEVSDEAWIEYLSEYSPFMADPKAPQPLSRNLIRLLDSLPKDSIDSLLEQGFVKWPYTKLDKTRQEGIRAIMQGVMSAVPPEHRGEKVVDLILSSLVTADVGFAVLKLPDSEKQFVAFFAQMPTAFGPTILPVLGDLSDTEFKEINLPVVQKQIENIVKQPDSNLPASTRTTGHVPQSTIEPETKQAFHELIVAAREASTDEEWAQVLAKHAPTLALTEESETEQFGKAEMALMREGGRILIELLAGLPDAVHNDLLQSGYLKWSFKELDEPRREAMQDALTNVISASDKMGFPAGLKTHVPEMLASGDVGFAFAETPKGQELVWYLLMPESPIPMLLPLFGTPYEGEGKGVSLSKSVFKQIGELENKPYSELLTLLKETDMQRLQGVWTFVRGEANGEPSTPRTLEIAANVWLLKDPQTGRTIQRMKFDIDPTQNPRHITVTSADFPQPMKGIYQFDGDELHITSASAPGGERPTEFDEGGAGKFFVVMRREPPPDQKRISMEQTLERLQKERDASQEISFAVWEADGKAVLRFANWLLVFEGIDAAPGLGGFSSFRVPHERYDDSQREGGGVTFGTDDSSLKLTIDQRIIDGVGHITVNDFRFRMEGRAEKLLFESETYSAGSDVQTIVVRASGKTVLK